MADFFFLALLGLLVEACVGYPDWLWRAIGHPVSWIGRIIAAADRWFNTPRVSAGGLRWRGGLVLVALLVIVGSLAAAMQDLLLQNLVGFALLAVATSTLLAQRSLHAHVRAVANALERSLPEGRTAVGHVVGRDVAVLDAAGVARAAIESLAENFSDGVVAPAFWTALAGLPGAWLYKAINTADSMIGHRSPRHEDFGKAAAKLDDVVNWPAARLAGFLLVCAAVITPRASAGEAWRAMVRDAPMHRSPNAGWPEAAMAGGLGFGLAGPRVYDGALVADAGMGQGRRDLGPADIRTALALYRRALALLWLLLACGIALLV